MFVIWVGFFFCMHAVIWYQVFQSNTNSLHTVVWFWHCIQFAHSKPNWWGSVFRQFRLFINNAYILMLERFHWEWLVSWNYLVIFISGNDIKCFRKMYGVTQMFTFQISIFFIYLFFFYPLCVLFCFIFIYFFIFIIFFFLFFFFKCNQDIFIWIFFFR